MEIGEHGATSIGKCVVDYEACDVGCEMGYEGGGVGEEEA